MDQVKQKEQEMLQAKKEVRKAKAKKQEEKKKRQKENEMKAGKFQVITKTDKIRKWHKNARKQLVTMSQEQIEGLLHPHRRPTI